MTLRRRAGEAVAVTILGAIILSAAVFAAVVAYLFVESVVDIATRAPVALLFFLAAAFVIGWLVVPR